MPASLSTTYGTGRGLSAATRGGDEDMTIKIKSFVRRQLVYGFEPERDGAGEVIGSSVVKLARRNAFELVGLKRPALEPGWQWKMI